LKIRQWLTILGYPIYIRPTYTQRDIERRLKTVHIHTVCVHVHFMVCHYRIATRTTINS